MKKNYIQPFTYIVKVNLTNMITASPGALLDTENEVNASLIEVKSHSYSVWDDDWSAAEE